ncbi:hypothetical protein [Endozoicomonas sp. ALB115]|uniref:hypothetical protein n=1 Tax=Endozoicomonas sp. ALB115 TaxID=3403074 RepID=UPI003BB62E0A
MVLCSEKGDQGTSARQLALTKKAQAEKMRWKKVITVPDEPVATPNIIPYIPIIVDCLKLSKSTYSNDGYACPIPPSEVTIIADSHGFSLLAGDVKLILDAIDHYCYHQNITHSKYMEWRINQSKNGGN